MNAWSLFWNPGSQKLEAMCHTGLRSRVPGNSSQKPKRRLGAGQFVEIRRADGEGGRSQCPGQFLLGLVESKSPRVVTLNLFNTAVPHLISLQISQAVGLDGGGDNDDDDDDYADKDDDDDDDDDDYDDD